MGVIAGGSLIPRARKLKSRLRSFFERKLFLLGVHMDYSLAKKYYKKIYDYCSKIEETRLMVATESNWVERIADEIEADSAMKDGDGNTRH